MNFLEKDLEDIISENYAACAGCGLTIQQDFFQEGRRYRQLNLAPYGIADLVNIRYAPDHFTFYVQIIELKKGKIDTSAYLQAKRYETALKKVMTQLNDGAEQKVEFHISVVLIGNEIELNGDFVFLLNSDLGCTAFTYSYGFNGIEFTAAGRGWVLSSKNNTSNIAAVALELIAYQEEQDESFSDETQRDYQDYLTDKSLYGDFSKTLLITSEGVLLNETLLELPENKANGDL